ncbi:MAG: hypothetical protein K2K00_08845, partial [Muribaculaceae bacterium]|nr:hypothetical protein [Muribaculaceae bacterium]
KYSYLNLPTDIYFGNGQRQTIEYHGNGVKKAVKYSQTTAAIVGGNLPDDDSYTVTSTRTYVGPHIYADGVLEYSAFGGGYFDPTKGAMYYLTDWHGNNAAVVDKSGTMVQSTTYYPYGEPTKEPTGQRFLYGGKEREHGGGRNSYDFSARCLIAPLGQWCVPDREAEKYFSFSPYSYCAGDPINYIDPDGMEVRSLSSDPLLQMAAENYHDNGNIIAFLHGSTDHMKWDSTGKQNIADGTTLMNALASEFESVDPLTMYDEPLVIELHSCETGFDKNGSPSLAQKLSDEIRNAIIIAPNGTLLYNLDNNTERVVIKTIITNQDGTETVEIKKQTERPWRAFFRGGEIRMDLIELCKWMVRRSENNIISKAIEKVIYLSMPSGKTHDVTADP